MVINKKSYSKILNLVFPSHIGTGGTKFQFSYREKLARDATSTDVIGNYFVNLKPAKTNVKCVT